MLEFILERYNYWIVIILMMTGLYIVYARGNLVKKIVGLNVFQTSIFIFYITIGKIAGGTAPIYHGADLKKMKEGGHGDGHGESPGANSHEAAGGDHAPEASLAPEFGEAQSIHSKIENSFPGAATNDLKTALENLEPSEGTGSPGLHESAETATDGKITNEMFDNVQKPDGFDVAIGQGGHDGDAVAHAIDAGAKYAETIYYTNPLPHVLILTAIVVGVAGTAVGLALAIRIREAYGTIEEDELEAIDAHAEFGGAVIEPGGAGR